MDLNLISQRAEQGEAIGAVCVHMKAERVRADLCGWPLVYIGMLYPCVCVHVPLESTHLPLLPVGCAGTELWPPLLCQATGFGNPLTLHASSLLQHCSQSD